MRQVENVSVGEDFRSSCRLFSPLQLLWTGAWWPQFEAGPNWIGEHRQQQRINKRKAKQCNFCYSSNALSMKPKLNDMACLSGLFLGLSIAGGERRNRYGLQHCKRRGGVVDFLEFVLVKDGKLKGQGWQKGKREEIQFAISHDKKKVLLNWYCGREYYIATSCKRFKFLISNF